MLINQPFTRMEKIKKESKWVSHELSELATQNFNHLSFILLPRHKKKQFLYQTVMAMKNRSIIIILSVKS